MNNRRRQFKKIYKQTIIRSYMFRESMNTYVQRKALNAYLDLAPWNEAKEEARQKAEDAELEQDAMKILAVWWSTREGE